MRKISHCYIFGRDAENMRDSVDRCINNNWGWVFDQAPGIILDFRGGVARHIVNYGTTYNSFGRRVVLNDLAIGWITHYNPLARVKTDDEAEPIIEAVMNAALSVWKNDLDDFGRLVLGYSLGHLLFANMQSQERGVKLGLPALRVVINRILAALASGSLGEGWPEFSWPYGDLPSLVNTNLTLKIENRNLDDDMRRLGVICTAIEKDPYYSILGYPAGGPIGPDSMISDNILVLDASQDRSEWFDNRHFLNECSFDRDATRFIVKLIMNDVLGGVWKRYRDTYKRTPVNLIVNGVESLDNVSKDEWAYIMKGLGQVDGKAIMLQWDPECNKIKDDLLDAGMILYRSMPMPTSFYGGRKHSPFPLSERYVVALLDARKKVREIMERVVNELTTADKWYNEMTLKGGQVEPPQITHNIIT